MYFHNFITNYSQQRTSVSKEFKQDQPKTGLTADELYEEKTKSQTALFIYF